MKLIGKLSRGRVFIISAPAGTGKTTLAAMLTHEFPEIVRSISYTTRPKRGLEEDGKDYYFVEKQDFDAKKSKGEFLETATIYGHEYGTSAPKLEELVSKGNHVLLIIDTQGAMQLKDKIAAVRIFISPPSIGELGKRLKKRKTESEEELQERLSFAQRELQLKDEYDYHILNDDLNRAYQILRAIVIAEEHRIQKDK